MPINSVFYPLFLSRQAGCIRLPSAPSRRWPTLSIAEALKTRMLNINRAKNCARSAVESDEFVIVDDHEFVRQQ